MRIVDRRPSRPVAAATSSGWCGRSTTAGRTKRAACCCRASGWRCAASPSSTSPAASSRSRTKTARCRSSPTARSTTFSRSRKSSIRARSSVSDRARTSRSWFTPTRSTAKRSSAAFAACSRSRSGTAGRRTLIAARDRAGEKPLYYTLTPQGLRLASEIKALLSRPEVDRALDHEALDQFLTYEYVIAPRTIFRSIRKLPAAHYLIYRDGEVTVRRYWDAADVAVQAWTDADAGAGAARDVGPRRAKPDDVRCADRAVPVGRHRFERRRA